MYKAWVSNFRKRTASTMEKIAGTHNAVNETYKVSVT